MLLIVIALVLIVFALLGLDLFCGTSAAAAAVAFALCGVVQRVARVCAQVCWRSAPTFSRRQPRITDRRRGAGPAIGARTSASARVCTPAPPSLWSSRAV